MIRCTEHPGRLFIDITEEGCPCGCLYCYVKNKAGNEVLLEESEIARLSTELVENSNYVPGPHGTLLAFGSHCDLFRTQTVFKTFLSVLRSVAPLGNPIQVSTKQLVTSNWAAQIAAARTYDTQIVVFISCATLNNSRLYEPGVVPPARRFDSFESLQAFNIPSCFYIKPFLPGVTNREVSAFIEAIQIIRPDAVCVGALYLNEQIATRLQLSHISEIQEDRKHPLMTHSIGAIDPSPDFFMNLQKALPPTPIFQNSACVVAYMNDIPCPTHVWERFPKLCVECRDCQPLYGNARSMVNL